MRASDKKELERTLRTVILEKCSSCNLFWWYSVAFPWLEREYLADAGCRNSETVHSPLFQKFQVFILNLKAHVRWTCKSGEGLFKTLSRDIYCSFNSWCKTHRAKCV